MHRVNSSSSADVSVIIPAYNAEASLERALCSVINQSVWPKEVIIVNDASTDNTDAVIENFIASENDLTIKKVTHSHNLGVACSRNDGWDVAESDYVAFLDADDAWHHDKIRIQYEWMLEHPDYDLTGHLCPLINSLDDLVLEPGVVEVSRLSKSKFLLSNQFSTPTVMLRKNIPYRFSRGKRFAEDYLLWLQIILDDRYVARLNTPLSGIFKYPYGGRGLSSQLWAMEKGELETFKQLHSEGRIPLCVLHPLLTYSILKYIRRIIIVWLRK